ncbi:MAG: MaoC family dehydratase [Lysobacterales bacterium]|jgi:acyl dehydratase
MAVSGSARYFEDYVAGTVHELGSFRLDEAEIIAFAKKYDPQDIHVDPEKAANGPFGGLIASGWQTAASVMRLYADNYLSNESSLGSPGLDELRWLAPVRPAEAYSVRATVLSTRRSGSKPDRGLVRTRTEVFDRQGTVVLRMEAVNFIACRTPEVSAGHI